MTDNQKALIENNPLSVATTDNKNPNLAIVAYALVIDDGHILFTDKYLNKTVENLRINEKICLATYDKDWNGLKICGTADYVTDGKYYERVKLQPENNKMPIRGAIIVNIEKIEEIG